MPRKEGRERTDGVGWKKVITENEVMRKEGRKRSGRGRGKKVIIRK